MFKITFAKFKQAPVPCEGDDVNSEVLEFFAKNQEEVKGICEKVSTDCVILWDIEVI